MTPAGYSFANRPQPQPRARLRAFTLLELVLALAMVAVLAVSLWASLRIAFRAKTGAETAVEPSRTAELAMEFLRNDIQNALPPAGILASAFVGAPNKDDRGRDADDLVFYSTADSPEHRFANGEIKKIELTVVTTPDTGEHVLVRRVTRNLLARVEVTPDEEIICRGVGSFNLRYFSGGDWLDNWDSSEQDDNALPAAVEVTLELDRPLSPQEPRTLRYVRVFPISCSALSTDNSGLNMGGLSP